jgi:biofilm PGA synthesis lipoprotein PgaB
MAVLRAAALWLFAALPCAQAAELTALVYHDVAAGHSDEPYVVSHAMFEAQLDYLRARGYQPIDLDTLSRVYEGRAALPEKALLLTFDDGLRSYADFVVPTLRRYGYPSVVSVVGAWADGAAPPEYQGRVMGWDELRALQRLPLVDIVSHTHDLHRGIPSNPQGNERAAATTRRYFKDTGRYEDETAFRRRIRGDVERSVADFKRHLGFAPRAVAWPYGYYDGVGLEELRRAGILFYMTMENGPTAGGELPRIRRIVVRNTPSLSGFVADLEYRYRQNGLRAVEVSLEPFAQASEAGREQLLSRLLDRLQALHANAVLLSPFSADRRQALFANRQLPVAGDLLDRVTQQILTRLRFQHIYLELPPALPGVDAARLYTELARLNWFNGVVFEAPPDPEAAARIRDIVRYYHPGAVIGLDGAPADQAYDFGVLRLPVTLADGEAAARVRAGAAASATTLVLLEGRPGEGREMAAKLALLRRLGVRDYGYARADAAAPRPAARPAALNE